MPKRNDIETILVIGSGPIVIGQACEFDYSGTQACKVLKDEGYRVVLVNSNPATIMTDPAMADRTYVEPITAEFIERVIAREHPDALLPTLGGQTGLNAAVELAESGILEKYGVEMIGCDLEAINRGEDRKLFNECMAELGIETARSDYAYRVEDALAIVEKLGYPVVLRPSFTMGGAGGGIAHNEEELRLIVSQGLELSPAGEVLVEESIEGWKEYEMEVMRDKAGNGIIVCSIENLDAMGVHTGDSITVAPAQTLSDVEYQRMRAATLGHSREGGRGDGRIERAVRRQPGKRAHGGHRDESRAFLVLPRLHRRRPGSPSPRPRRRLAVGYTLDEIVNDITKATPACFEPSIDYCVVKVPRFAFEKFQGADDVLSTRMKAVGEVMAIGRTFEEALGKAMRSLENGRAGLNADGKCKEILEQDGFDELVGRPTQDRIFYMAEALRRGWGTQRLHEATGIDPWFIDRMRDIVTVEENLRGMSLDRLDAQAFRLLKRMGLSDVQIGHLTGADELEVRARRKQLGIVPAFKTVDTCAAEFPGTTAYHYKTYDADENEAVPTLGRKGVMILGAGPNRIGQGIEFDYCCVHASYALRDAGYETIMVNCNPETVSTDYDTSDKLYFEPLTFEDVMDIVDIEQPEGVVVTLGGQTPLKLAAALQEAGVNIMGTKPEAIDLAEDRDRFRAVLR